MSRSPKELVLQLVEARNERAAGRVAELVQEDVAYWDCVRGHLAGRDDTLAALALEPGSSLLVETLAGDESHAVVELRAEGPRPRRVTEVHRVGDGARIAECRIYLDPVEL